jgi:hypothetical protein
MDELCLADFVLPMDLDTRTNAGDQAYALEQTIDQVSRRRLNALEREFKDPDGMIAKLPLGWRYNQARRQDILRCHCSYRMGPDLLGQGSIPVLC